ncbi:MAG: hypothetical protein IIA27_02480 [Gemmatimonadetes bacterium]|nr:hypothetical protein [Gemmatimonadota bacterium]
MNLQQARRLLQGVREAQKRKDLPESLRVRLKRTEALGRKSVAAKLALARRPDYKAK